MATDSEAVAAAVEKAGGRAVMTRADHVSGSDRIYEALEDIDPRAAHRHRRQRAGRPADHRSRRHSRRAQGARRSGRRHRDACRRDHRPGRAQQSERGQGVRRAASRRTIFAPGPLPAPMPPVPGRTITTSGSTPIAAPRSNASSSCRRRPTSSASGSSSCARSITACASTLPWSKACRLASIRRRNWTKARKMLAR